MLPDRVSNPGPLTYESGALPIALCGPAWENVNVMIELLIKSVVRILQCDFIVSERLLYGLMDGWESHVLFHF